MLKKLLAFYISYLTVVFVWEIFYETNGTAIWSLFYTILRMVMFDFNFLVKNSSYLSVDTYLRPVIFYPKELLYVIRIFHYLQPVISFIIFVGLESFLYMYIISRNTMVSLYSCRIWFVNQILSNWTKLDYVTIHFSSTLDEMWKNPASKSELKFKSQNWFCIVTAYTRTQKWCIWRMVRRHIKLPTNL